MKKQNGITLNSLIIYIVVMVIVIGIMASVTTMFYNNVTKLDNRTVEISKFNIFNNYFVKEIKSPNNAIDTIANDNSYILFKSGNFFSFKNDTIYYNDLKIIDDVKNATFKYCEDTKKNKNNDVITVNIEFDRYSKQINYKVEEIY